MTLEPLLNSSLAIQIHVAAAILAFLVGGIQLLRRKGGRPHRIVGRLWVALMAVVVVSSFWIDTIGLAGPFSPLHLLSVYAGYGLVTAVIQARQGRIAEHRRTIQQVYFYAVIGAGAFTLLPGRRMHEVLFGGDTPAIGIALVLLILLGVAVWRLSTYRHRPSVDQAGPPA